jgi:hypothetical protein
MTWSITSTLTLGFFVLTLGTLPVARAQQPSSTTNTAPQSSPPQTAQPATQPTANTAPPVRDRTAVEEDRRREEDRREEEREDDDDGRGSDLIWIEGAFGYSYVDLVQFSQDNFLPSVDRFSGSGFAASVAAGFRIQFLTIGARGSLASYTGFEVGSAVLDVALRIPTPVVEPFVRAGFGYGWVGNADYETPSASDTSVFGLAVELGGGIDIYLSKIITIGGGFDAVFLNLSRQRIDSGCGGATCMVDEINFEEDGDSVGLQMRVTAHVGLHF